MSYVITSNGKNPGYYVARNYNYKGDPFKCIDFIAPVYYDYFKRLALSQELTFETVEDAKFYLNHNGGLIPNTWKICKYDPCYNDIIEEITD